MGLGFFVVWFFFQNCYLGKILVKAISIFTITYVYISFIVTVRLLLPYLLFDIHRIWIRTHQLL